MKHTIYRIPSRTPSVRFRAAIAADLHGDRGTEALRILAEIKPDMILIPGDLSNHFCIPAEELSANERKCYQNSMDFLRDATEIAPVYYSLGNHEMGGIHSGRPWAQKHFPDYRPIDRRIRETILSMGVHLLDDSYVMCGNIAIGALTSGLTYPGQVPNLKFLSEFDALDSYKLLLCHHPEYYPRYIRDTGIDLTVSGHAHGGQWSFFGQAVFAPGQGLFPRLVRGVHEDRLAISRGLTNSAYVPRIGVPCEVVEIVVE